jgi:hypothetical protein
LDFGQRAVTNEIYLFDNLAKGTYGFGIGNGELQIYSGQDNTLNHISFGTYGGSGSSFVENVRFQNNGYVGIGTSGPARSVHLVGDNACFRMDRDVNSSAFILVRTAPADFSTVWKTFFVGVNASGVNNGSFFIGDVGTNVSGPSQERLVIDNLGNVGIGTTSPTGMLDVNGSTGYNQVRIRTSYTPTGTSDANGNTGDIAWDADYVYVKTGAGWKRSALKTF